MRSTSIFMSDGHFAYSYLFNLLSVCFYLMEWFELDL